MVEIDARQLARQKGYDGKVADAYLQYVDLDRRYSTEQLREWAETGPIVWAEKRIAELILLHRLIRKRNKQLTGVTLASWWERVEGGVRELLRIYPQNFVRPDGSGLLVVTDEEMNTLPSLQSKEGKALTQAARDLDDQEWDWIHGWLGEAHDWVNDIASLQHNESSAYGWTSNLNSNGNKLLNKLHAHELRVAGRLRGALMTRQDRS